MSVRGKGEKKQRKDEKKRESSPKIRGHREGRRLGFLDFLSRENERENLRKREKMREEEEEKEEAS